MKTGVSLLSEISAEKDTSRAPRSLGSVDTLYTVYNAVLKFNIFSPEKNLG